MYAVDNELNLTDGNLALAASSARQDGSTPSWIVILLLAVAVVGGAYACSSRKSRGPIVQQTQASAPIVRRTFPKGWSYIYNTHPWKMADGRVVQPNMNMFISWHVDRGYRYLVGQDGSWQGWIYYPANVAHRNIGIRGLEAAAAVCSQIRFKASPPVPQPNASNGAFACPRKCGTGEQQGADIDQAIREVGRIQKLLNSLADAAGHENNATGFSAAHY